VLPPSASGVRGVRIEVGQRCEHGGTTCVATPVCAVASPMANDTVTSSDRDARPAGGSKSGLSNTSLTHGALWSAGTTCTPSCWTNHKLSAFAQYSTMRPEASRRSVSVPKKRTGVPACAVAPGEPPR
jgi:hypothetical protein